MRVRSAGNAVNHIIGLVVEPLAIVDNLISNIGTWNKGESTDNRPSGVYHHITAALFNVVLELFLQWIAFGPLVYIAVTAHDFTGLVAESEDDGEILLGGMTESVFHFANNQAKDILFN